MNARTVGRLEDIRSSMFVAANEYPDMPTDEWSALARMIGTLDSMINKYWMDYNAGL